MSDTFETAERPVDGVWGNVAGLPITDEVVERLVQNAEAGFPGTTIRPVGRPRTVGRKAAKTVTVRLDQARVDAIHNRAKAEHTNPSEIMRRALDHYLAS